ncbi:MAG: hypothetical protein GYA14_15885 [Ignavibacteria bacterium]|nr:hypothetical protein [Ignavibacteria bacterium]
MKTLSGVQIGKIITAENPERYAIRFKKAGQKSVYLLLLQIEEDNYILTVTREEVTAKSKCKVLDEGEITEFCSYWNAIQYGILDCELALQRYFNDNNK